MSIRRLYSWGTALALLCTVGVARAAESETAASVAGEATTSVAGEATPDGVEENTTSGDGSADIRRRSDASVDRNILMPSAETVGEGETTFNSYELFLAGVTYGVTDDIAISATVLLPIIEDFPAVAILTGKFRLYTSANDIFSLQPSFTYLSIEGESAALFGAHALYDHIFDDEGKYTLTLAASTLGVLGATSGDIDLADGAILGFSGAFSARLASIVKLMTEIYLPGAITSDRTELVEEALLLNYGVRFFSPSIAVDLTFLRPIHPDQESPLVMGIPFVTFSARF